MPLAKSAITTNTHFICSCMTTSSPAVSFKPGHSTATSTKTACAGSRALPVVHAAILARREDPAFRLAWRKRIPDHDGDGTKPGGIERWLKVVEATGLSRDLALRGDGILPATRFAVQAYVDFVSTRWHREEQDKAHAAVRAKCDILRAQLDALYFAYVNPGWPPPGALQPAKENA